VGEERGVEEGGGEEREGKEMDGCPLTVSHICQGTLAAVLMRVNIHASTLNKGGSGDPGVQSAVGHTA
jgi:hypothetical protein